MAIFHYDVIQGTSTWATLRAGIPTASQFDRIVTPGLKESKSERREMYLFELLAERLTGEPTVGFTSHWMDRGSDLEKDAVLFYELQRDIDTTKIGFVTNDSGTIGASPDRCVGEPGLLEIKVPKAATHVGYLLQSGTAYAEHRIQTQGQLWVAEREWNDLLSYHPLLPPALVRIYRDEDAIEKISLSVEAFSNELERLTEELIKRGWMTKREPKLNPGDDMIRAMKEALRP